MATTTFGATRTGYVDWNNTLDHLGDSDIYCTDYLGVIEYQNSLASILGLPSNVTWNDLKINSAILSVWLNTDDRWWHDFCTFGIGTITPSSRSMPSTYTSVQIYTGEQAMGSGTKINGHYFNGPWTINFTNGLKSLTSSSGFQPSTNLWYIYAKGSASGSNYQASRIWRRDNHGPSFTIEYEYNSNIYVYQDNDWVKSTPYIYINGDWQQCNVNRYNGSTWEQI